MAGYLNNACLAVATLVVASYTSAVQITEHDHLIVTKDTKCITALGNNQVKLEPCTGADSQVWRESVGFFQSQFNGECLTANKDTGEVTSQVCGLPEQLPHQSFEDWKQLIVNDGQRCLGSEDGSVLRLYPSTDVDWCQFAPQGRGAFNSKIHAMAFKDLAFTKGQWQDEESACSASCGDGIKMVQSVCKGGSMMNSFCNGNRPEGGERPCNAGPCANSRGTWSEWGECSATSCEEKGFKGRVCDNGDCLGNDILPCKMEGCSIGGRTEVLDNTPKNQPGQMRTGEDGTKWTAWSKCSNDCGEGTRSSYCVSGPCTKFEEHEDCYDSSRQDCDYIHVESKDGRWSPWSECSVTCGTGSRTRECLGRQGHGKDCDTFDAGTTITCVTNVVCSNQPGQVQAGGVVEQGRTEVLSGEQAYDPNPANPGAGGPVVQNGPVVQVSNDIVDQPMVGGMQASGGQGVRPQGVTESSRTESVIGENSGNQAQSGITGSFSGTTTNFQAPVAGGTTTTTTTNNGLTGGFNSGTTGTTSGFNTGTTGTTSGFNTGTTGTTSGFNSGTTGTTTSNPYSAAGAGTNPFSTTPTTGGLTPVVRRGVNENGERTVPVEVAASDTQEMLRLKIALAFHEAELADEENLKEVEKKQAAHELAEKKAKRMFVERLSYAVGHYIGMKDHNSKKDNQYYYMAVFIVCGFFVAGVMGVATVFLGAWYYMICKREERMRKVNAAASAYDMHSNVYLNKHSSVHVPEDAEKDNDLSEQLSGVSAASESDPEDIVDVV